MDQSSFPETVGLDILLNGEKIKDWRVMKEENRSGGSLHM